MTIYDIFFDDDNDMVLDGGDIKFATEDNIIKQRLTLRLQFLYEEWFLNTLSGLPYTQFIFTKASSLDEIYALFRKHILATRGVEDIVTLELTPSSGDRGLRVDFSVNRGTITSIVSVSILQGGDFVEVAEGGDYIEVAEGGDYIEII